MGLLDLFVDDYDCDCHIVVESLDLNENGKRSIENEIYCKGRFFAQGNINMDNKGIANQSNAELYVPCDIAPELQYVTSGYVEIANQKYNIIKTQKAKVFNEVQFTRIFLQ